MALFRRSTNRWICQASSIDIHAPYVQKHHHLLNISVCNSVGDGGLAAQRFRSISSAARSRRRITVYNIAAAFDAVDVNTLLIQEPLGYFIA